MLPDPHYQNQTYSEQGTPACIQAYQRLKANELSNFAPAIQSRLRAISSERDCADFKLLQEVLLLENARQRQSVLQLLGNREVICVENLLAVRAKMPEHFHTCMQIIELLKTVSLRQRSALILQSISSLPRELRNALCNYCSTISSKSDSKHLDQIESVVWTACRLSQTGSKLGGAGETREVIPDDLTLDYYLAGFLD